MSLNENLKAIKPGMTFAYPVIFGKSKGSKNEKIYKSIKPPSVVENFMYELEEEINQKKKELVTFEINESLCVSNFNKLARKFGMNVNQIQINMSESCYTPQSFTKIKELEKEITRLDETLKDLNQMFLS